MKPNIFILPPDPTIVTLRARKDGPSMVQGPRQEGFSAIIVVLIVIAIGIIAFVSWRVFDAIQQADKSFTDASKASEKVPELKNKAEKEMKLKKVVVPGIDYEIEVSKNLVDLTFRQVQLEDRLKVYVSTATLAKLDARCGIDGESPALGALVKMPGQYKDTSFERFPGFLVKQFDNHFISYDGPQGACSDKNEVQDLSVESLKAFQQAAGIKLPS